MFATQDVVTAVIRVRHLYHPTNLSKVSRAAARAWNTDLNLRI